MKLIGSTAIKEWYPDFPRNPKDFDYIVKEKGKFQNSPGIEYLYNPVLYEAVENMGSRVTPNYLYTLKLSHAIGWDIKWDQHVFDIQFLKKKGCTIKKELFYNMNLYESKSSQ